MNSEKRCVYPWQKDEHRLFRCKEKQPGSRLEVSWCGRQDSNLHAKALDPKSSVSASFTTPAKTDTDQ